MSDTEQDPSEGGESDPLDRLAEVGGRVADRATYEQGNRRGLLWVHASMGLLAGVQMALWGSASTIETALGTWTRILMAVLGMAGGLFLARGLRSHPRSIPQEALGLSLIGLWDFLMTIGLGVARLKQADYHLLPIGHDIPVGYVVAYPTTIYGGLFVMICIHLSTLTRLRKRGLRR